ncbi:response regulator transcription factor [Flavobacterium salilacus subsp. salilacus]|uniref:response regulator n=1 Tax=Flavobacterium TaxID=237 RepID=UPI001389EF76|nr:MULTISPECIES: response regulator [Flavobacterium]KAF2518892.1 response regulator transcription factor [Flavobacterium salilacus subsp. salilacus]MBE1614948.1 response regulator transcription factor [Flavobacterium sp. SaA2.13]NDI98643.1 response regulator transcription factor [Flavobacterium salilacus subsp. altitudinum]
MKKVLHVLAIDDHVVVLEGYHAIFKSLNEERGNLDFIKATDCKSAYELIHNYKNDPFDIAVVDYSIPDYAEKELYSGADMAGLLREVMPECKIIMMTMHKEVDIMGRILETINPEGFINKSDCTTDELFEGFKAVLAGENYYSKTVSDFQKRMSNGILLDELDIRIIKLLAKGIKNKNLDKYIPLTVSGIEKRKYRIKRLLDIEGGDEELIFEARKQGYI